MGTGRVVCVGVSVLDVVQRVVSWPDWGRKSVSESVEVAAGGPAANAAVTAAALLGGSTLVTALGDSTQAGIVRADLAAHGVEVVDCAPPGWELTVSTCILDAAGERTVLSPPTTDSPVRLTDAARAALLRARVLLVDGHHRHAGTEAIDIRPPGCLAVLDAGSAKAHAEEWLPRLDVVAGSVDYARGLGTDLPGALAHVLSAGAAAGVMTDGAAPLVWGDRDEPGPHALTPPAVTARDTLGAGDAFHGGLAAALAAGRDLRRAVEIAAAVASRRVAHVGARGWLSGLDRL